jgi:NTP pyrophosphatase (non-canonical NTP hydrolase)
MTYEQLESAVIQWANDKGLLDASNDKAQFMKVSEELGELASAILKGDDDAELDAFGDVMVTLIILSTQRGVSLKGCLNEAYNVIKNRTGKMQGGTFIKDKL